MLHRAIALMTVAVVLACTAVLQAETSEVADRFMFSAANAPQDGLSSSGRLQLVIRRWSTDDERARMLKAVGEPATLLDHFRDVGTIGHLQWPGGLEYSVRYARRTQRADGSTDIVLVTERPLWVWWDSNATWSNDPPYTVVHLRVGKDGTGEGRASSGTAIQSDAETGVGIADPARAPLLIEVRRESIG